jgi:hypothetical protein
MAELDPNIVLHALTPLDIRHANDQHQNYADVHTSAGLSNTEAQQKIDQTNYDVNFRKKLNDLLSDPSMYDGIPKKTAPQPTVTPPTDAMGNPTGIMGPQSDGVGNRPSLAAGDGPNPTGPGTGVADNTGLSGDAAPAGPAPTSPVDTGDGSSSAAGSSPAASPNGRITLNTDRMQSALGKMGYGYEAMKMNPAIQAAVEKGLKIQKDQYDLIAAHHERLGSRAAGILRIPVDESNPDPKAPDKQMFLAAAVSQLKGGLEDGDINQAHAAPIMALIQKGDIPDLKLQLGALVDAASKSTELHKSVAEGLDEVTKRATGQEDLSKKQTDNALQALSTVTDQAGLDRLRAKYPDQAKGWPVAYDSAAISNLLKQAVPVKDQPEYEIKAGELATLKKMTPADWDAQIDAAVPPGPNALLNSRTKALVKSALAHGDFKAAQSAIKDGSDQIGAVEKGVAIAKATAPIKISVAGAEASARSNAGGTTADDYARAGEEYTITGTMPALGRDSVSRNRIMHAAMDYQRSQGLSPRDVVMARAAYAGDKSSLSNLTKQRDQINSFEEMAGKNLDTFLERAGKVVDKGSPWINKPLRTISEKGLGDEDMAALNAARAVATNEVAKVTSGGSMSGVLSDAARNEVKDYSPRDATLKQTLAVVRVLRRDMQARHDALDNTVSRIRERSGNELPGGSSSTANGAISNKAPVLPLHLSVSDVGKSYVNKAGKTIKITAVNPDDPTQFRFETQ